MISIMAYQNNIYTRAILLYIFVINLVRGKTLIKSSDNVEDLDYEGRITLGWTINESEQSIIFELEGETDGYVGLGISLYGTMAGADIFIAGVLPNGSAYDSDRFVPPGTNHQPRLDAQSNWKLLKAEEVTITSATKRGHTEVTKTYLKFLRFLDTCDEDEDLKIGKDPIKFIWALGENDDVDYHGVDERGTKTINLYKDPKPSVNLNETQVFELTVNMSLPDDDSYWCTFYQGPELDTKHHVVAWSAVLGDANAHKFVSHLTVYNCSVSAEYSLWETFQNYTIDKFEGCNCMADFKEDESEESMPPTTFCTEMLYTWSMGNKELYLPDSIGIPIGEDAALSYYMLEIHFKNPENLQDVELNTGIYIHYDDKLREFDAGLLWLGQDTNLGSIVAPNVTDFVLAGHCSPTCTKKFPSEGITIFNTMLYARLSGKKLKLRHFRQGRELPWIDHDDHYNHTYQQNKQLVRPVHVLPGDQITLECTFDTMWKNGTVKVGSLSWSDDMCQGYVWYYPKMDVTSCGSNYPLEETLLDFGIEEYHNISSNGKDTIEIDEPESLQGEFETVLNTKFNWSLTFRKFLQLKRRYGLHESVCYTYAQRVESEVIIQQDNPKISYPLAGKAHPYSPQPPLFCSERRKESVPSVGLTIMTPQTTTWFINLVTFMLSDQMHLFY